MAVNDFSDLFGPDTSRDAIVRALMAQQMQQAAASAPFTSYQISPESSDPSAAFEGSGPLAGAPGTPGAAIQGAAAQALGSQDVTGMSSQGFSVGPNDNTGLAGAISTGYLGDLGQAQGLSIGQGPLGYGNSTFGAPDIAISGTPAPGPVDLGTVNGPGPFGSPGLATMGNPATDLMGGTSMSSSAPAQSSTTGLLAGGLMGLGNQAAQGLVGGLGNLAGGLWGGALGLLGQGNPGFAIDPATGQPVVADPEQSEDIAADKGDVATPGGGRTVGGGPVAGAPGLVGGGPVSAADAAAAAAMAGGPAGFGLGGGGYGGLGGFGSGPAGALGAMGGLTGMGFESGGNEGMGFGGMGNAAAAQAAADAGIGSIGIGDAAAAAAADAAAGLGMGSAGDVGMGGVGLDAGGGSEGGGSGPGAAGED